jgi:outer membrane protein OmpA-like peptidoglycan-associated protein
MKAKIFLLVTAICMLFSMPANAKGGFWRGLGNLLKSVAEGAVVAGTDYLYDKYAPEAKERYQRSMQELNEVSERRAQEEAAAWEIYNQGRQQELRAELSRTSDFETRQMIRQEMDELNGVSSASANYNETSLIRSLATEVGIKDHNVNRGLAWNEAQNKYDRQNVAKEYVFDAFGEITNEAELFNRLKELADIQITYLSDNRKAMAPEEKQQALSKRNRAYATIGFNAYQAAQDRRTQYLADKLDISKKLIESGLYNDSQLTNEVAGTIIAIQQSDLPQDEKESLLRSFGYGDAQQVELVVNEVLSTNYDETDNAQAEIERIKAEQEAKRQAELKAAEDRRVALQTVDETKIDSYPFDVVSLSDGQKAKLDDIADILNKYSDVKIEIVGHTCNIGYKNINLKKGLKRAEAGREYLIGKNIASDRISVESKGETEPIVSNTSNDNRKQNRRIEIIIK